MHLVFHVRLAHKAMTAADHPHDLEALDRSGRRLHCLKASGTPDDSFECSMIGFDNVVQVLACPVFCARRQFALPLQPVEAPSSSPPHLSPERELTNRIDNHRLEFAN